MKFLRILRVGATALYVFVVLAAATAPVVNAETALPPLFIREIKVSDSDFIVIQATTNVDHLKNYWLGYSSNERAVNILPSQQLPGYAPGLRAGQSILLTNDANATCDALVVGRLNLALGETRGVLELRALTQATVGESVLSTVDRVNWLKPSATATTDAMLDLRKETGLGSPTWYRDPTSAFNTAWRIGSLDGCSLTLAPIKKSDGSFSTGSENEQTWRQGDEPVAVFESPSSIDQTGTMVVETTPSDMAAPFITELLPNPVGTGNDATDEFIELYNPNDTAFDLSGFILQTGLTTKHSYAFPTGTMLGPKGFRAFYASETGLSLSNSGGQAALLSQDQKQVAITDPYGTAADGQAWVLAQGVWYWTARPTPTATNVVLAPITTTTNGLQKATTKTGSSAAKTTSGTVKAATTTKAAKSAKTTTAKTTNTKKQTSRDKLARTANRSHGIHPGVLVIVAAGAIGYCIYEYRHDVGSAFHRLRGNRIIRRITRR